MEDWQLEFEWGRLRNELRERFSMEKSPDLNAVLVLIGVQELGFSPPQPFEKEIKQDLMHIAVCRLLSEYGIFEYEGLDEDGWPHFKQVGKIQEKGEKAQEQLLINCAVNYFKQIKYL